MSKTKIIILCDFCTILVSMKEQFGAWMDGYGKEYATEKEYNERLEIFSQNAKMVYEHNAGKHSYTSKPQLSPDNISEI